MSTDAKPERPEVVGILGGSFNPVHIGHLMLGSYLVQWKYVDRVWLTLSPRNPLKDPSLLVPDVKRLAMLGIALKGAEDMDICDLELAMPRPSYTINTLRELAERYPDKRFRLIIGSDNWRIFDQWKNNQEILDKFGVLVYLRPGYPIENRRVDGMEVVDAPMVNLSSTFVRDAIARGRDVRYFLPEGVYKYIQDNRLYIPRDK